MPLTPDRDLDVGGVDDDLGAAAQLGCCVEGAAYAPLRERVGHPLTVAREAE